MLCKCTWLSGFFFLSVICFNGGKWNGKACECPSGFAGDQCQQVVGTCWNGGVWDGIKCLCPELYQGPKCEEVVPSIGKAAEASTPGRLFLPLFRVWPEYGLFWG